MRKRILSGAAAAVAALALGGVQAGASTSTPPQFLCNTTVNGGTLNSNVVVPDNGVCVLKGVTVNGGVTAGANAYFESDGSQISGSVNGSSSLTLYIWDKSTVGVNVAADKTAQLFLYDSTVGQNVGGANLVAPGYGHFQVCGSTIGKNVGVAYMGPDVLIGDAAAGCGPNVIQGNLGAAYNTTDQELYVIGNSLPNGGLYIANNLGAGDKQVTGNKAPNGTAVCSGNSAPFNGSGNTAAKFEGGQCSA